MHAIFCIRQYTKAYGHPNQEENNIIGHIDEHKKNLEDLFKRSMSNNGQNEQQNKLIKERKPNAKEQRKYTIGPFYKILAASCCINKGQHIMKKSPDKFAKLGVRQDNVRLIASPEYNAKWEEKKGEHDTYFLLVADRDIDKLQAITVPPISN